MADRIVVMHGGVVEQIGRPLELYDRPANLFVAGFIGSPAMNLLQGKIEAPGIFLSDGGARFPVSHITAEAGRKVVLGVRPEHLELVDAGTEGALAGTVVVTEPTGSETHVSLRTGADDLLALFHSRLEVAPGEIFHFRPSAGAAHLFDQDSGKRIA